MNPLNYLKVVLIFLFPFFPLLPFFTLFFIYPLEAAKAVVDFFLGKIKRPILTKKAILLILIGLGVELLFFLVLAKRVKEVAFFNLWLLIFDIFTPIIVSLIVLSFQPLAVLGRNRTIKKAREKRARFKNLLVIGVTGSYGKTSTKEFIFAILREKFGDRVLKTRAHQNSEVGISQCVLNDLKEGHDIFIVEMGAYGRGGIKLLCDIVRPKIGVLTGINEQHMATFGSQENIVKTKYELIESLPKDGVAFFNAKNKYCLDLYRKTGIKKFLYGETTAFFGEENILGAMAVAKELGMSVEEIQNAVNKIENKMPGIQVRDGVKGLKIIDATYSANPDGVIANLEYLKSFPARKVIVMPCLIELGPASSEVHRRIGAKMAEVCDLAIITTKDRLGEIREAAGEKVIFLESPKTIFEKINSFCQTGDAVLLESRVPKQLISLLTK